MPTSYYEIARDFHIFDFTQNTIHSNIMYLYWGHSAITSLGKGSSEESNKNWNWKEGVQSKSDAPLKNSSMYFFL